MTMQDAVWLSAEKAGGIEHFPAVGFGAGKLSLPAGNTAWRHREAYFVYLKHVTC